MIMKLFYFCRHLTGVIGILYWIAACSARAQIPTKVVHPTGSSTISEKVSEQSSLAAIEATLRRDLDLHPESAPILYKLGVVLRQENKPKESLEVYTRAAKLQRPDAEQLRSVALDYVLLNDYHDAINWLEVALSYDPQNPDVLYNLGRCFYIQGRFQEAEAMYLRVLQIKPESVKAEENLGLTYEEESQPEKAEAALRSAATWAAQQSSDEWPFLNFGTFLLTHGRPSEAIQVLQKATSKAPKSALCHEKLGRALAASGEPSAGVTELQIAVQLDPKNPQIHFELGRAYRETGAQEKARGEFALSKVLYGDHSHEN